MDTRYEQLAGRLYQVLETPVSIIILKNLNDKQLALLDLKIINATKYHKMGELFEEDLAETKEGIKSILNFGKSKLPVKRFNGTGNYLSLKK